MRADPRAEPQRAERNQRRRVRQLQQRQRREVRDLLQELSRRAEGEVLVRTEEAPLPRID